MAPRPRRRTLPIMRRFFGFGSAPRWRECRTVAERERWLEETAIEGLLLVVAAAIIVGLGVQLALETCNPFT